MHSGTRFEAMGSREEGIDRVRRGGFGFITNTLSAHLAANQRPCDLTVIDTDYGLYNFGFAVPKNQKEMTSRITQAIDDLFHDGFITELEQKWEQDYGECWEKTQTEQARVSLSSMTVQSEHLEAVSVKSFGGPLLLLLTGVILSMCATLAEILFGRYGVQVSVLSSWTGSVNTFLLPSLISGRSAWTIASVFIFFLDFCVKS